MAKSEFDQHLLALGGVVVQRLQARGIQRADAEDAVATAYEKIIVMLPDLSVRNFDGWFYRIALNAFLDSLRRRQNETLNAAIPEPAAASPTQFAEMLAPLPANQQELLALKYYYGFSYQEIAQLLGLKPASVKTMLARARASLRTKWEE
ncbi:RNA polymerase sigma factor [Lacticaseibacillus hegangensis]|uniref:RNA polymerase sigma factor n=1 Tax=Lacticaseibacillus hegangensis TaxID=2486010 RepID=A0ABW4CZ51_9LACO|nr:RNA polymerase sigma factor [Lacticaseibacillus hegangensis]